MYTGRERAMVGDTVRRAGDIGGEGRVVDVIADLMGGEEDVVVVWYATPHAVPKCHSSTALTLVGRER
jgi:hypothetical protein